MTPTNKQLTASALALIQCEYPNYHPLTALARLAHQENVIADPWLELSVHKCILPYVTPKLSSIEANIDVNDNRRVVVSLFEEMPIIDVDEQKLIPVQVNLDFAEEDLVETS